MEALEANTEKMYIHTRYILGQGLGFELKWPPSRGVDDCTEVDTLPTRGVQALSSPDNRSVASSAIIGRDKCGRRNITRGSSHSHWAKGGSYCKIVLLLIVLARLASKCTTSIPPVATAISGTHHTQHNSHRPVNRLKTTRGGFRTKRTTLIANDLHI